MFRGSNTAMGLFILRVVVGFLFLMHGLGKLVGPPFIGPGMDGWTGFVSSLGLPLPQVTAWVGVLVETLGGAALILGTGTTLAGLLLAVQMFVAIVKVRLAGGLDASKGGFEYELLLMTAAVVIVVAGPGMLAVQIKPKT